MDLLVADLEALRQAWGLDRITIVGHSWGGLLAMEYGVRHPDRLDRLVLVDSAPTSPELLRESYRVLVGRMPEGAWGRLEELYASDAYLAGDPSAHNEAMRLSEGATFHVPSAREEYFRLVAFDGPRARNMAALAGPAQGIKDAVGVAAGLARITCPTLVVYGAQDFIVPAARRRLAEQLPDARLVEIPECGHYPFIEQPGTFAAELRRFVTAAPRDPMAR